MSPGPAPVLAKTGNFNHLGDMAKQEATDTKTEQAPNPAADPMPKEIGGQKGPEPTRYGDWEKNGRCTDF